MSTVSTSSFARTDAQSPFNQPSADITIRTSDHVDFHVHSQILSQASPVFATMFELPQPKLPSPPAAGAIATRPVVDVAEDSTALDTLLRLCYPVKSPVLDSAEAIESVLEAALKYDMEWPTEFLTQSLLKPEVISSSPLRVWAIGCWLKLEDVARHGAEAMFQALPQGERAELGNLPGVTHTSIELEGVSAGDYDRCLSYINRRRAGQEPLSPLLTYSSAQREHLLKVHPEWEAVVSLMAELPFHGYPPLHPANDLSCTDIICISIEGDVLRAHQCILALHSPILRERILALRLKATSSGSTEAPLVLKIDLSSYIFHYLLSTCYMGDDCPSLPYDIYTLSEILLAAKAYQMKRLIPLLEARWSSAANATPFWAYICAEIVGLAMYAKAAARLVVWGTIPRGLYFPALDTITARAYHRLVAYYEACHGMIREELRREKDRWEKTVAAMKLEDAQHTTPSPVWVSQYIDDLEARLKTSPAFYRDWLGDVFKRWAESSESSSPSLRRKGGKFACALHEFASTLPPKIEEAIDRVSSLLACAYSRCILTSGGCQVEWKY